MVVLDPAFDHRVVLVDSHLLGLTEVGNPYVSQWDVEVFRDGPHRTNSEYLAMTLQIAQ